MRYELSRLSNGLRVITVPMRDRDSSGVAIWVRTGGRFETKKISGISHFLEHMLFKGTEKRTTREIKEEIEGVGGMLNAFTGEESTCYFSKLLKRHFYRAMDVLSDMVNHAVLAPKEMTKERTVILEEIKMYLDLPSHHVYDLLGELLWPNQPLGWPISGTPESVSSITRSEMAAYKKKYYHPKNIVVTVSGEMEHSEVLSMAERLFPQKSSGEESHFSKAIQKQRAPQIKFLEKKIEQTHFVMGFHGLSRFNPDRYKLGVLNIILGANMSSRLFEEVREKRGLAYEIKSGVGFYQDTGSVTVSAGVEANKAHKAMAVILRELEKFCKTLVTEDELRRAKDYFISQLSLALEDTLDHLLWVGERVLDGGELPDKEEIRGQIEAVTAEDVRAVARQVFTNKSLNLALIGPVGEKIQKQMKQDLILR